MSSYMSSYMTGFGVIMQEIGRHIATFVLTCCPNYMRRCFASLSGKDENS